MHIDSVHIKGFRNFSDALINFRSSTLVIGANDVGKSNLLFAMRMLLDRSLPETVLEPSESDFHVGAGNGKQVDAYEITVKFTEVTKDSVVATLKGAVSATGETYIRYRAEKKNLSWTLSVGSSLQLLEGANSRFYLRFMNLRYVQSQRDLMGFVQHEKRHLLRLSKEARTPEATSADDALLGLIDGNLNEVNEDVRKLNYVNAATSAINEELRALSHHHEDYEVRLETGSIDITHFIEQLELSGSAAGTRIGLGGDGRNNQILMALWKAKSEREQDLDNECIIYCIEEPEAHLHPHQQRKLAEYLVNRLKGQVFVTTHSPQIAARFAPDSIVRLVRNAGASTAASNGCSDCISEAWTQMGYRMSILPAEAFFAEMVFLVEGPSEVLFYHELARQLAIDLDRLNISILAVDGIDFEAYVSILGAMEIPWAARTDNDVFKVPRTVLRRLAGLNRARLLVGEAEYPNIDEKFTAQQQAACWYETSALTNPRGIFIATKDLENDLVGALPNECLEFAAADTQEEAVEFFQDRKAINMGQFLRLYKAKLSTLKDDGLARPLLHCVRAVGGN